VGGQGVPDARRAALPADPCHLRSDGGLDGGVDAAAEGYATCRLIETIGSGWPPPEVQRILPLHDETTRASQPIALA
jgi:hypothetical protein